jgi:hypothetical protein
MSDTKPKNKKRFYISIEGFAPVKAEFEVWAFDEDEAYKHLNNPALLTPRQRPDIDLPRIKRHKVTIKDALTSQIKLVKNS